MDMQFLDDPAAEFERCRGRLFGIAYRMRSDVQQAEDVIQEAYLRWHRADRSAIDKPEAWLVTVVSRLSIDWVRRAATDRVTYVGSWLPEPIIADEHWGMDRSAELASDLSMAFLVLLERLGPEERAALLLREVFDTEYQEIALILEKSEAATRHIVHRIVSSIQTSCVM